MQARPLVERTRGNSSRFFVRPAQFAGFSELEPLVIPQLAPGTSVAALLARAGRLTRHTLVRTISESVGLACGNGGQRRVLIVGVVARPVCDDRQLAMASR